MRSSFLPSQSWAAAAATGLLLCATSHTLGGAFEVLQQGARASGQAEAFAAQADDVSAIWYNPAGLTQLDGTNFTAGGYLVVPDEHFKGTLGNASNDEISVLPHVYAESDFGLERFRFGLGINNVFGLKEDWGQKGPLSTVFTQGHLYLINVEPTVAFKFNEDLSIGLGVNIYYGSIDLEHHQPLGAPPAPVGYFRAHGDDYSAGVSPAVMWKVDEHNTLAAFYHSPFSLDFDGNADITGRGFPAIGPSHAHATLHIPQIAGIGYALRPVPQWKLEADVVWSNWHTLQEFRLRSPNPAFNNAVIPTKYHDTWSFRLGTQYDLTKNWALRAGYAYGNSAVPQETFSNIVPDANYHLFSAGVGYTTGPWSIDAAYLFILRETRNISNSINSPFVDGKWNTNMQGFMVSVGYKL